MLQRLKSKFDILRLGQECLSVLSHALDKRLMFSIQVQGWFTFLPLRRPLEHIFLVGRL
jgi:hypothetical protein